MAAQSGPTSVSYYLHGVPGRCPHAGPSHQERPQGTAENGGQFPQVT